VADYDGFSEKYGEAAKGGSLHSSAPSLDFDAREFPKPEGSAVDSLAYLIRLV
jgi:hypothetical protein